MSVFLDKADQIAARLKVDPGLSSVVVLVDRQKDMAAEFPKAMGKAKGGVVIILFDGYRPDSGDYPQADDALVSNFSITVWTKPVLRRGQPPADDLVEAIHTSLHGWKQEDCRFRAVVRRGRIINNPRFLIHELQLEIKHLP
ncbi:MAG: hypothetical protein PVJ98_10265 [Akkermansiaceae bacterium]|jgi:hypothetical protein